MNLSERIKSVRKKLALTQKSFSEPLEVSSNYIYLIENGRETPSKKLLKDICRIYNVNYDWLVNGNEEGEMFDEEGDAQALVDAIMTGDNEFAKKTFVAFAKMPVEYWKALEYLIEELKKDG